VIKYRTPVQLTHDFLVIDADNKTLLPDITWKPDNDHRERQKELGIAIVAWLNGQVPAGVKNDPIFDNADEQNESGNNNGYKKRRVTNPWGRKGRPRETREKT